LRCEGDFFFGAEQGVACYLGKIDTPGVYWFRRHFVTLLSLAALPPIAPSPLAVFVFGNLFLAPFLDVTHGYSFHLVMVYQFLVAYHPWTCSTWLSAP
jgi:hypothetical protein